MGYSVNYIPADVREYIHLAGRVGRIGQSGSGMSTGGKITCIVSEDDDNDNNNNLDRMIELSNVLDFNFIDLDVNTFIEDVVDWSKLNVEDMRRYLEDKITLLDNDDDNDN